MNYEKFILILTLVFLLCSCDNNSILLQFNTQNSPIQTFTLESDLNVFAPEDSVHDTPESMETHLNVKLTLKQIDAFDDEMARFEMKVDTVDYKSDKRTVEEFRYVEKNLLSQHFQFKMDKGGVISDPALENMALQPGTEELNLIKLFMKIQPIFPSKPVSTGDVWEREVQIPGNGNFTTVYKSFKLDDYFLHDGLQMAKIKMNIKYKEFPDTTANIQMKSNDFIVGSGSLLFDITHGVISSGSLEFSGHLDVNDLIASEELPNMHVIQKLKLRGEIE